MGPSQDSHLRANPGGGGVSPNKNPPAPLGCEPSDQKPSAAGGGVHVGELIKRPNSEGKYSA